MIPFLESVSVMSWIVAVCGSVAFIGAYAEIRQLQYKTWQVVVVFVGITTAGLWVPWVAYGCASLGRASLDCMKQLEGVRAEAE